MTPRKQVRGALNFSIADLWARRVSPAVREKLEAIEKALKELEDGKALEARRFIQKE